MVSNKKSIKKFKHSGKRKTKRYTDCVEYVKSKGAEVDEPEVEQVHLEHKGMTATAENIEPSVEEIKEEEVIPPANDFKFEEPENFQVQGNYINGDRVVVDDPLALQNATSEEALTKKPNSKPEIEMVMENEKNKNKKKKRKLSNSSRKRKKNSKKNRSKKK